jgi:hypothetical protein
MNNKMPGLGTDCVMNDVLRTSALGGFTGDAQSSVGCFSGGLFPSLRASFPRDAFERSFSYLRYKNGNERIF